jgi:hypothetical protein
MSKKLKPTPVFEDEAQERKFWETHDSGDYLDWSKAERVRLPNLKPSRSTPVIASSTPADRRTRPG